jgi:hypothetical protein
MHLFVVLQVGERLIDNVISSPGTTDGSEDSSAHIENTPSFVLIRDFQADHADLDLASYISQAFPSTPLPAAAPFRTDCPKYSNRRASDLALRHHDGSRRSPTIAPWSSEHCGSLTCPADFGASRAFIQALFCAAEAAPRPAIPPLLQGHLRVHSPSIVCEWMSVCWG